MFCEYGCGHSFNFVLKNGKHCCSKSVSSCPEIRKKNSSGLKKSYDDGNRPPMSETYKNFSDESKESMAYRKGKRFTLNSDIFVENSKYDNITVKERILKDGLFEYKCADCGLKDWQGKNIVLELEHCNGVRNDHRIENLKFLCPNCHSQTDTFRGRNAKNVVIKVTDDEMINALNSCDSIRQALIKVGLAPKGANYSRAKKLLQKQNKPTKDVDTSNSQYGTVWLNNGTKNIKIKKDLLDEYLNEGWIKGRLLNIAPPTQKGKIWVNDGLRNKMVEELPEGWNLGKI